MALTLSIDPDAPDELAEALYLAYLSAGLDALDNPHAAPRDLQWQEADETTRSLWRATAKRLIALHRAPG
jgi:hypothetical protein